MKNLLYSFVLLLTATFCFVGCNNNDDSGLKDATVNDPFVQRLSEKLAWIIETKDTNYNVGGFVVYMPEDSSMNVCDFGLYRLIKAIVCNLPGLKKDSIDKSMDYDTDWNYAGTCKNKDDVPAVAAAIKKKLLPGYNLMVCAEALKDGAYKVSYYVEPEGK